MDLVVDDARKFLVNVVGTQYFTTTDELNEYFKGKITTKVKNYLSKIMAEVSYYNITQHLEEISEALHAKLKEDFSEYGVNLKTFFISNIIVPRDETAKLEAALNKKMEYGTLGFGLMNKWQILQKDMHQILEVKMVLMEWLLEYP